MATIYDRICTSLLRWVIYREKPPRMRRLNNSRTDYKRSRREFMNLNFRTLGKIGFLLVIIGFISPIIGGAVIFSAIQMNGFEYAELGIDLGATFPALLMYGTFAFAIIGLVIGVLLLLKKNVPVFVDWILIVLSSGGIIYLIIEDGEFLLTGAYIILVGLIIALIFQIISAVKKDVVVNKDGIISAVKGVVENGKEGKFNKITESPFFTFSKPYLDFISKGKIFGLVYLVMALINIILPFVVIYMTIRSGLFSAGAKYVFALILTWLVIFFACWIGFQLWWNRRKTLLDLDKSQFIATVIFSEILQTFGEWIGTLIGIIGAGVGLLGSIFLGNDINELLYYTGLGFMRFGIGIVVIGPVVGFFIIIFFRFIAEQLRMFASLVNNTKEIANNCKGGANG